MLYTFFDVETSGLEYDCDVLSFSYMLADENLNVKRAETLYFWKEGVTVWTQEAYEVNGLSKEFLRKYEAEYDMNLKKMYIVLSYAVLVGYNSGWIGSDGLMKGFDYLRCKNFLIRNGLHEPKALEWIDVMQICTGIYHRRRSLSSVYAERGLSPYTAQAFCSAYFGESGEAHQSGYDTVMTALLFQQLYVDGYVRSQKINDSVDYNIDIGGRKDNEWFLMFGENSQLLARNDYDDVTMDIKEFSDKFPVLFDKMMKDPYAYMRQEG